MARTRSRAPWGELTDLMRRHRVAGILRRRPPPAHPAPAEPGGDMATLLARWESLATALSVMLGETATTPAERQSADLAAEVAHAAADALALLGPGHPPPPWPGAQAVLDVLHVLRHDLGSHADRLAHLTNAATPVPPEAVLELSGIRQLLERAIAQTLWTTAARPPSGAEH